MVILLLALLTAASFGMPQEAKTQGKAVDLNNISLEVAALQVLHDLELTPAQITALTKLARESAPKGQKREPAKASADLAKALTALHTALTKGDDNAIGDAQEKLNALMEKEQPELDNAISLTQAAREKAGDALKLLNVRQAGNFLSSQELTDPAEFLRSALEEVRKLKDKELEDEIAMVAEEVAWLVDGIDGEQGDKIREKVASLLNRASALKSAADFARQRKSFDEEIKGIVGEVDNADILGHILEHGMAELLSNPRCESALRSIRTRRPVAPAPPRTPTKAKKTAA
jgi:hypothetical protein